MRARMNLRSFNPVVLNRGGFCPLEDICLGTSGVVMMGGDSWCPVGRGGDTANISQYTGQPHNKGLFVLSSVNIDSVMVEKARSTLSPSTMVVQRRKVACLRSHSE